MNIIDYVKDAGVVGAGGAGFPTHVKLQAKADTVIANGSECEPLLWGDKEFLKQKAHLVVQGLQIAMEAVGAKQGFIAMKGHYKDVVDAVNETLRSRKQEAGSTKIEIAELENYYPAGDEFMLVYDVTGRVIPEGGLPLHVQVVVNNIVTLAQVAEAASGKPVTRRFVTINGEVKRPCIVSAPIGALYSDLIAIAGGTTVEGFIVLDGGPMMGKVIENLNGGIAKTTSGILVLPSDHFVVQTKKRTISQELKRSRSACCQCFRCTDLCPRHNLGHELFPHMTMRTIDYNMAEPAKHVTSAFLCSQCGACEMIACDIMGLSPKRVFAEYRRQLVSRGLKNPHTRAGFKARDSYKNTKVSIATVLKKMGLTSYAKKPEFLCDIEVTKVKIPLGGHTGVPAVPSVKSGDKVRMCDLIAVPPDGKLGAAYHASIAGTVTDTNGGWIVISG